MSYCNYVSGLQADDLHVHYHNYLYGFPLLGDDELFGRMVLEINQAGLSWTTILKKEQNFRKAFNNYNIQEVARFGERDRIRLLSDAGIIRNRLKIDAVIYNAQTIEELQRAHGSFSTWLESFLHYELEEWIRLFKKTFKFTGPEIVKEFLMSTGYIQGAHTRDCFIYPKILDSKPAWLKHERRK
jgi:DNA-3-methyladenine glycosylase I